MATNGDIIRDVEDIIVGSLSYKIPKKKQEGDLKSECEEKKQTNHKCTHVKIIKMDTSHVQLKCNFGT